MCALAEAAIDSSVRESPIGPDLCKGRLREKQPRFQRSRAIALAVGLIFMVPVRAGPQESEHAQKNANELARWALQNEVNAEANDHTHWMLKLETEKPGRKELYQVVESKNGDLERLVLINGRPLTAKQEHDADEQI